MPPKERAYDRNGGHATRDGMRLERDALATRCTQLRRVGWTVRWRLVDTPDAMPAVVRGCKRRWSREGSAMRIRSAGNDRRVVGIGLLAAAVGSICAGCMAIREEQAKFHTRRGDACVAREDLRAALVEFQEAAKLAPQLPTPYSRMGGVYRRLGEYENAISNFVEAIRRDPESFDDTFNLGQLYHLTKRVRDAIQAYLHAVEIRPRDFDAQMNLGVCYQTAGETQQAIERFERAVEIHPDRPHAYVNLGVALDSQERYYDAVRAFKDALERDSRQPQVLVSLAQTYMNQNRLRIAREALHHALDLDPELATAHEALGYCLFRLRNFDAAENAYKSAIALDRKLPRAYAGLGSVYMLRYLEDPSRTDQRDRALERWHQSLEQDPDQPRIRKLIAQYSPNAPDPAAGLIERHAGP